jgi:hypothetical protein
MLMLEAHIVPIDPVVSISPMPEPRPGPAPSAESTKASAPPMPPDRVEKSRGGGDPGAMVRALQQHAQAFASAATATVGRGLQAVSKTAPEIVDGATARMAGLAGVVVTMPGEVPHDAAHGYGVSAGHPGSQGLLEARRDARTLAPAMQIGVSVQTVNGNKPPKPEYEATRKAFTGTLSNGFKDGAKAQFIQHVAQTQPDELNRLGFSESQIKNMATKAKPPLGLEVHHRVPIECGGTNDFENLTLVREDVNKPLTEAQMAGTKGLEYGQSRQVELLMTKQGTMYPSLPDALNQPSLNIPK